MNHDFPQLPLGRAAIFNGAGSPFKLANGEIKAIGKGEILVKNLYTTICGSDIHTYCGLRKEPDEVVLGHEIVGEILWMDENAPVNDHRGDTVKVGDRIVWAIFAVPAEVVPPRADIPQKSEQLFKYGHALATSDDLFNGGLADYCVLRANTMFLKISSDIPLKAAATISCAHATVAGALRTAGNIAGKRVLIFGAGLLGLSCSAMCKEAGASRIGFVDTEASRLKWASQFGADDEYLFDELTSATPPASAEIVFDMTGHPDAMLAGVNLLALGGCAVWIGAVFPSNPVQLNAEKIVRNLVTIKGLHNYNYEDFVSATVFIEQNYLKYPFDILVERDFNLSEVEDAFSFAKNNKPVRVGVKIS